MSKKIKVKIYRCEYSKSEYDDWGKYHYCRNPESPVSDCWCEWATEHDVCPFYKKAKGDKGIVIEEDKKFLSEHRKEFFNKIMDMCSKDFERCFDDLECLLQKKQKLSNAIKKLNDMRSLYG